MKKTDLAYYAGIIDGEGAIGIAKHKRKDTKHGYYFELQIQVTTADEWLAHSLKFAFGGHVNLQNTSGSTFTSRLTLWKWTIHARQALVFLKAVLPYLKLKHYQAEIAVKFQEAKRIGRKLSDEALAVEEAQRILIHSRTRKGKKILS